MNNTIETIQNQINKNPILLYMKGTPTNPKCGFSMKAAQILSTYTKCFTYINVLDHIDIRTQLPIFSNWPTFPQLWIQGKLIGGTDIIINLHRNNKLKPLIESAIKTTQKTSN